MRDQLAPVLKQSRVRQSFCRGLQSYHQSASVQAQIAQELVQQMQAQDIGPQVGRALEFGAGTGHLTAALLEAFEIADLTLNDLVPEAEAPLRRVLSDFHQPASLRFGPIETLDMSGSFDLITSSSAVQWIEDLPSALHRLADHLRPGGWLGFSGFGCSQFHQLAELGSVAAAPSYLDARDWPQVLPAGMSAVAVQQQEITLQFDSALDLLRHLRRTGVNGQASRGWTRADLRDFDRCYRARFGREDTLPLSYDAVWILARKL
ncbi:methyltransferase [Pseudophaeobacter sp.]|uniref:methyltransferase n=1 Tax=Pseudophaeobacter sp. TaxID=1971739 RepID=UPI00329900B9